MSRLPIYLAVLLPLVALAGEEQFGFKGLMLGAPIAASEEHGLRCTRSTFEDQQDASCSSLRSGQTIAGHKIDFMLARHYGDHLKSLTITFAASAFTDISDALKVKYGEPTRRQVTPIQNRAGATFENITLYWERPDSSMKLDRYWNRIDTGALTISTADALTEFNRRRSAKNQDRAKDL